MDTEHQVVGDYLLSQGLVNEDQLARAQEEAGRMKARLEDVLVHNGVVTEQQLAEVVARHLGVVYVDLNAYEVDAECAALVTKEIALRLQMIPLFQIGRSLSVGMVSPVDMALIDEIGRLTHGLRIKPVLVTHNALLGAIERVYGAKAGSADNKEADAAVSSGDNAEIIQLVNRILEEAVSTGVSDVHLEPAENDFICRFRIDGILYRMPFLNKKLQQPVISRIKIMAEMDIAQSRIPQDGRIQTRFFGREVDLRIASFPTLYGEHIAIRLLDKVRGGKSLETIGLSEQHLGLFRAMIKRPYGIILVTGPTGSGKTTSLYGALSEINDSKKNILTLEDPVEYTIPGIHHSQINIKAGLTFASGLRAMMRLDPDIIMIGEIRDQETAEIAIRSSLTGHLVLSTLHTNDACSAVMRLVDIGIEPYLVASSLAGVLAQRLVRCLCRSCRKAYLPSVDELARVRSFLPDTPDDVSLYKPAGCPECRQTGHKDRVGVFELFIPGERSRELIIRKASAQEIKESVAADGFQTLQQDAMRKVLAGVISLAEALALAQEG